MPVNYSVKAVVVDLRLDTPKPAERFYVDTNAWFWTVYSNVQFSPNPPHQNQTQEYPSFLKRVLNLGGQLVWCGLPLSELAHLIERTEWEIYCQATSATLKPKEYRHHLPTERARVVQEIQPLGRGGLNGRLCEHARNKCGGNYGCAKRFRGFARGRI